MGTKRELKHSKSLIDRMEVHLTLTESEELQDSLNGHENELPHFDENFNLDEIPIDVLDKAWERYHPYLMNIYHRHPLANRLFIEGTDYKKQIEGVREIITTTFPIPQTCFKIVSGNNGMYAAILVALLDDNVDVIEQAMEAKGFFRSKPTDDKLLSDRKNRRWIDVRFEPKFPDDVTEEIHRKYNCLYHLSPKSFEVAITMFGFKASNKNADYRYSEDRVYFLKGDANDADIQALVNTLYIQAQNKHYPNLSPKYVLFKIDLAKLGNEYRFFYDINEPEGIYSTKDIPPSVIVGKKEITASTNDKL